MSSPREVRPVHARAMDATAHRLSVVVGTENVHLVHLGELSSGRREVLFWHLE